MTASTATTIPARAAAPALDVHYPDRRIAELVEKHAAALAASNAATTETQTAWHAGACAAIEDEIAALQPATLDGLIAKARLHERMADSMDMSELATAIVEDLVRLADDGAIVAPDTDEEARRVDEVAFGELIAQWEEATEAVNAQAQSVGQDAFDKLCDAQFAAELRIAARPAVSRHGLYMKQDFCNKRFAADPAELHTELLESIAADGARLAQNAMAVPH